jgi:hypothetical protein
MTHTHRGYVDLLRMAPKSNSRSFMGGKVDFSKLFLRTLENLSKLQIFGRLEALTQNFGC